jgi:DNA-binding NarL/FixJ family response regulator
MHKLRESGSTAKFVFVTVHSEGEFARHAWKPECRGTYKKGRMNRHLVPAINAVLAGQSYISIFDSDLSHKHS